MDLNKILGMLKNVLMMLAPGMKSTESTHGTKEVTEALVAANEITLDLIGRFKDGVGFEDFAGFWTKLKTDAAFEEKLKAGFDQYALIPAEVKDIDGGEGMELAAVQIDFIPKFVDSFKKEEVVTETAPVAKAMDIE